jgi:outer membrane protein assembly factor BamB
MQFDAAHEPIVVGQRLIIGSSRDNSVTSYDTRTGEEQWTYFTEGPVRFAPAAWGERIYIASDDGYLYCLRASDGALAWRFRGGPSERKVLGNERLISAWPARGAPVVTEGTVYFAAGIWPFEGVFLHALDAQTGEVIWTNDGDGSIYIKQPHNADSFAGVAPQGPLVAVGDKLLIPGGRSVPACYDRATGRLLYYQLAENAKRGGGSTVAASDRVFFNGGAVFDLATESHLGSIGQHVAFDEDRLYDGDGGKVRAWDLRSAEMKREQTVDRRGEKVTVSKWSIEQTGEAGAPRVTALIKAGSRLYVGSEGRLLAYVLPLPKKGDAQPVWEAAIEGTPLSLVAADDRLFAATQEGSLYCFGPAKEAPASPPRHEWNAAPLDGNPAWSNRAESILAATGIRDGYCLAWGDGSGGLVEELARRSELRIIVIEPDTKIANAFRRRLRAAGVGGDQVSVIAADPQKTPLPPYLASLAVAEYAAGARRRPARQRRLDARARRRRQHPRLERPLGQGAAGAAVVRRGRPTTPSCRGTGTVRSRRCWTAGCSSKAWTCCGRWTSTPAACCGRRAAGRRRAVRQHGPSAGGERQRHELHLHAERHLRGLPQSCVCSIRPPARSFRRVPFARLPAKEPPLWGYINVDGITSSAAPIRCSRKAGRPRRQRQLLVQQAPGGDGPPQRQSAVERGRPQSGGFRHNGVCIGGGGCMPSTASPARAGAAQAPRRNPEHKPRLVAFDLATGKELWSTEATCSARG